MEKSVHFDNTQIGFSHKSNGQLTKMKWLFTFLNYPWIVSIGSTLALWALKLRLPFFQDLVKHTRHVSNHSSLLTISRIFQLFASN